MPYSDVLRRFWLWLTSPWFRDPPQAWPKSRPSQSVTEQEQERRGEAARRILNDELYKEAFDAIEARLVSQIAVVEVDPKRAEYLRQLMVANRKIRQYLEQVLVTGTLAAQEIERRTKFQELRDLARRRWA